MWIDRRTAPTLDKTTSPAPLVGLFLIDIPTAAKLMSTTVFAVRELCRSRELAYIVIATSGC